MIERLNRTFKSTYRVSCGYDNYNGANYNVALWVAYYNFLRPHKHNHYRVLNPVGMLEGADNMPREVAAPDSARSADHPPAEGTAGCRLNLFLDSGPEVKMQPSRRDLPLMARQNNAIML